MDELAGWDTLYVIVGSAGGALVGIQFVVLTLIATMRRRTSTESVSAFGTPNVVHLGSALSISALMNVPWPSLLPASAVLTLFGFAGASYSALIFRRACRQTVYQPEPEDWLWCAVLPCLVYVVVAFAGLLLGIHNACDTVTYIVTGGPQKEDAGKE